MADETNAHSSTFGQVKFPDNAVITVENLYHFLDHDIQEAAVTYDLSVETIRSSILSDLILAMLSDGTKQWQIIDFARIVIGHWKQQRGSR